MITNVIELVNELKAERDAGDDMARQLVERIDAHIRNYEAHVRDLETLKAWVLDAATARSMALLGMLGGDAAPVGVPAVESKAQDEAA